MNRSDTFRFSSVKFPRPLYRGGVKLLDYSSFPDSTSCKEWKMGAHARKIIQIYFILLSLIYILKKIHLSFYLVDSDIIN